MTAQKHLNRHKDRQAIVSGPVCVEPMTQAQTDRQTDRQTDSQTDRRTDGRAGGRTDGRTDGQAGRQAGGQAGRRAGRQACRQAGRQASGQAVRQTCLRGLQRPERACVWTDTQTDKLEDVQLHRQPTAQTDSCTDSHLRGPQRQLRLDTGTWPPPDGAPPPAPPS